MSMRPRPQDDASKNEALPRSLYVPKRDTRENLRDMVNAIFSDSFMIFLSLILIPLILLPFLFAFDIQVITFFEIADWIIVVLFVSEYVSKLYVAKNRWKHFTSPWHLLDLVIIILPFLQYLPLLDLTITGSPSLLLRLLRLPRALAVGGRVIGGRRNNNIASVKEEAPPPTVIRQVGQDLKINTNLRLGGRKNPPRRPKQARMDRPSLRQRLRIQPTKHPTRHPRTTLSKQPNGRNFPPHRLCAENLSHFPPIRSHKIPC